MTRAQRLCRRGVALWLFVVAWAGTARAEEASVEGVASETASLGWSRLPGTETCATAIELGARVEALVGRDVLVAAPDAELSLEGRIERTEAGYRATIAVTRRDGASEGERVFEQEGTDCSAATEPLALILALLIDPEAGTETETEAEAEAETEAEAEAEAEAETETEAEAEAESGTGTGTGTGTGGGTGSEMGVGAPFGVAVDLSGMFSAFVTPSAAPAGRSAIHLRFPSGPLPPLAVAVVGWLSPWSRASAGAGSADFLFAIGGAGLCTVPRLTPWLDLSVCVLGEAGGAFVVGQSMLVPSERERVVFFFEASATLRAHVYDALTAHLGLSLAVPFRTEPWLASGAAYWRPDPIGLFAFLGVGFDVGFGG